MDHHEDKRAQPWKVIVCDVEPQDGQNAPHNRLAETNAFKKGEHIVIGGQGLSGDQEIIYDTGEDRSSSSSSKPKPSPDTESKGTSKPDQKSEPTSESERAKEKEAKKPE